MTLDQHCLQQTTPACTALSLTMVSKCAVDPRSLMLSLCTGQICWQGRPFRRIQQQQGHLRRGQRVQARGQTYGLRGGPGHGRGCHHRRSSWPPLAHCGAQCAAPQVICLTRLGTRWTQAERCRPDMQACCSVSVLQCFNASGWLCPAVCCWSGIAHVCTWTPWRY